MCYWTSCYHGLCDIGSSISVIPYSLYLEIKPDIDPIIIEEAGMTIQLAKKDYINPLGIVKDVEVLVGKIKYPAVFVVLGCAQDSLCPIIFGRLSYTLLELKLIYLMKRCLLNLLEKNLSLTFLNFLISML
jgi:hypothetical protein